MWFVVPDVGTEQRPADPLQINFAQVIAGFPDSAGFLRRQSFHPAGGLSDRRPGAIFGPCDLRSVLTF